MKHNVFLLYKHFSRRVNWLQTPSPLHQKNPKKTKKKQQKKKNKKNKNKNKTKKTKSKQIAVPNNQEFHNFIFYQLEHTKGIKFCVNDCLPSAYFAQRIIHFPKTFLPIGSNFLAVQSKEKFFWIKMFYQQCSP